MKTIKNYFMIVALALITFQVSEGQNNITMNSTPAPGVYEAGESITLQPGFSFTASPGNSLTLRIAPDNFIVRMNHIFQPVDKSRVATGLLADYGLQMADPEYFNGVPADSNFVDMDTWRMLYSGMFTSRINNNVSITNPETVFTQIDNATHATAVPVAMMHWQYNVLKEDALTLGLMQVVNGDQLQDVPNAASPYDTRQLFAAAPKKLWFGELAVSFVFKSNLWHTNVGKTIQKREISFDQGASYAAAGWDAPVSHTFGSGGVKTVYFRLTYTDGSSYTSQTRIYVEPPANLSNPGPAKSYSIPDIQEIIIPPTGAHSGGTIEYELSSANTTGKIRKPLIVAEGFDIGVLDTNYNMKLRHFLKYSSLMDTDDVGTINVQYPESGYQTLSDKIDIAGYDIVYLDYNNGLDDIFRNAALFRQVIDTVNAHKQKVGSTEQNVVMGVSMGGLVARIALRQMELANQNHQTWKYISVDSPHKGANVPVGFQAAVRHFEKIKIWLYLPPAIIPVFQVGNMDAVKLAVNVINSMAAKQMLIYYVDRNYSFDNTAHNQFQADYDNLGFPQGFPSQPIENIAISNGSASGTVNFPSGSTIIDYQDSYHFKEWMDLISAVSFFALVTSYPKVAWNAIPGHSEVKMELQIDALKNQSASEVYHGHVYIRKTILFLIPVNINIEEQTVNSAAGMLPLDGAPGGMYSLDMMGAELPIPSSAVKQPQFCFIPTVSSLALNDWNTKLTQDIGGASNPFNSVYIQNLNELHTRFNSPASFLYSKLTSTTPAYSIIGPDNVYYTGSTFALSNTPTSTITWTLPSYGAFSFSQYSSVYTATGNTVNVYRIGSSSSNGQLTASIGGSTVATKNLTPCAAAAIEDYGASSTVYYTGSNFSVINYPGVTVYWTVSNSAIFNVSPASGSSTLVSRIGSGTGSVTLSAHTGSASGPVFATKTLTPCAAPSISGPGTVCGNGSSFSLTPFNPGTTV
ncbi:MAG: hypothetical protein LBV26_02320, partial [Bacteroidales bacterium]|nr:hypothetical protein [Bacteroidales bacterium]